MYTQITSGSDIVILPAAEFGNAFGDLSTVKIQRSMVGTVYSTIKRTQNGILKLHFNLERAILKQLQYFVDAHAADVVTIQDWAGRIYLGYLYNDNFDSTEDQQWSNSIDLLFEGKRLI